MSIFSIDKTPKNVAKELASKFKGLRNKAKLSRRELAERSGVPESSIKRFETTGNVSLLSLLKISQTLKRMDDFNQLFNIDDIKDIEKLFSNKMKPS